MHILGTLKRYRWLSRVTSSLSCLLARDMFSNGLATLGLLATKTEWLFVQLWVFLFGRLVKFAASRSRLSFLLLVQPGRYHTCAKILCVDCDWLVLLEIFLTYQHGSGWLVEAVVELGNEDLGAIMFLLSNVVDQIFVTDFWPHSRFETLFHTYYWIIILVD